MPDTLSYRDQLVVEVCWCGMHHAVPRQLRDHMNHQHENGERQVGIYCPLGHSWVFGGESEVEKERKRTLAAESKAIALRDQLDSETRAHAATKGQLTKTRKRVAGGVCPCCKRHFVNMERHMASKHPNLAEGA